jgi:hypothetical protein
MARRNVVLRRPSGLSVAEITTLVSITRRTAGISASSFPILLSW